MITTSCRSTGYQTGWLGRLHHQIADRAADLAWPARRSPAASWTWDVAPVIGYASWPPGPRGRPSWPGPDPAPAMIEVARARAAIDRLGFSVGAAEQLPYPDLRPSGEHHLVLPPGRSAGRGSVRAARVLVPDGHLIPAGQFLAWLFVSLLIRRRGKARTKAAPPPARRGGVSATAIA